MCQKRTFNSERTSEEITSRYLHLGGVNHEGFQMMQNSYFRDKQRITFMETQGFKIRSTKFEILNNIKIRITKIPNSLGFWLLAFRICLEFRV